MTFRWGLTFDDVLLQPLASSVLPSDADTGTMLTRGIELRFPCPPPRWIR
jgi:IMP dehydrogenase